MYRGWCAEHAGAGAVVASVQELCGRLGEALDAHGHHEHLAEALRAYAPARAVQVR